MRIAPVLHQLEEDTVAILGADHLVQILQALIDLYSAPMTFERVVKLRGRDPCDFASEFRQQRKVAIRALRCLAFSHTVPEPVPLSRSL